MKKSHPLHQPVLVNELTSVFGENKEVKSILDCTFGRGGHSLSLLNTFSKSNIIALDRDKEAIEYGKNLEQERIKFIHANFHNIAELKNNHVFSQSSFDLILMDLGPSSPQLDSKNRGFSFYQNGDLDMRMDQDQDLRAKNIVNEFSREELVELFKNYGEIRNPFPVVDSIYRARKEKMISTTHELSQIIQKKSFWKRDDKHPATKYFLALRMKVNNELDGLKDSLPQFYSCLNQNGALAVITFHSLEDRIIKYIFRDLASKKMGYLWNKKVIKPSFDEVKNNPRSRSAKLRVFVKDDKLQE